MDTGTVKTRLLGGFYGSPDDFAAAVRLTFENAMTYNLPSQLVHEAARKLLVSGQLTASNTKYYCSSLTTLHTTKFHT